MRRFILFIVLTLDVLFTPVLAGEGRQLLEHFLNETKTMTANFSQTLRTDTGSVLQESKGVFYLRKPRQFRWNYTVPYAQEIVSDGENIWNYDVDLQQVTVQKNSAVLDSTPMAVMQDTMSVDRAFDIKPLDEKAGVYRMLLISRSEQTDFKNIILGVDKSGLKFMQLKDQFDQVTDIVFSEVRVNLDISVSLFKFEPPEGTDVFGGN